MIVLWCVQVLLYIGFSGIYILIATWTRGSFLGIALGIFSGCGITNIIYNGINWLVNKTGIVQGFSIYTYMVESNMKYVIVDINNEYIVRAMLVGVIFIVVTMFASIRVLNKKDI